MKRYQKNNAQKLPETLLREELHSSSGNSKYCLQYPYLCCEHFTPKIYKLHEILK